MIAKDLAAPVRQDARRVPRPLTRKGLAQATGCGIETVRYYEGAGLMPEPARGENGYRLYGHEDVRRLGFVLRARRLGMTVEDVRDLLALVDGERVTCGEVRAATLNHLVAVRARIADLQRLERTLADVSSRCSGDAVPDCPVIDALMEDECSLRCTRSKRASETSSAFHKGRSEPLERQQVPV